MSSEEPYVSYICKHGHPHWTGGGGNFAICGQCLDERRQPSIWETLVRKLAPACFNESEGGFHDLGMWLDCGDITKEEYEIIERILDEP